MALLANNVPSRIAYAEIATAVFRRYVRDHELETFFFVTLSPNDFVAPLSQTAVPDLDRLKVWASKVLRGFCYIAIVEPAYYGNISLDPRCRSGSVSWHCHALVWGTDEQEIRRLVEAVSREFACLVPGASAAHLRKLKRKGAEGRLAYMLKAPLDEYLIYPLKAERVDPETGEVTTSPSGRFRQRKRPIRPGAAIRMQDTLSAISIPMLTFAGRNGNTIWDRARQKAKHRILIENARYRDQLRRKLRR
jgi:hypothetical protein